MFNYDIKYLIDSINKEQKKITDLKKELNFKISERDNKEKRNYNKFKERFEEIDKFENDLKVKFDNKYFNFIKHYDFLDESYLKENNDFSVNKELGCLVKHQKSITGISGLSSTFSPNRKKITYQLREKQPINSLEYSFYSAKTRLPIIPKSIQVKYDNFVDDFFENYFRYYNLNNTNNFVSNYLFEPKMIKEIIFTFDEEVNENNAYVKIYSIRYKENNSVKILVENTKKIKTFNISKKSNESFIDLKFSYSEDNVNFEPINFNGEVAIFTLKDNNDFVIKIESNNQKKMQKENFDIKSITLNSKSLIKEDGKYELLADEINRETIDIIFPTSSMEKLKSVFAKLSLDINNFFDIYAGVNQLKKSFIKNINDISESDLSTLKFFDDEQILKTKTDAFSFYIDTSNKLIHTSSFFNQYDFYISYQYKENLPSISDEYYTPMLFEFSLKG